MWTALYENAYFADKEILSAAYINLDSSGFFHSNLDIQFVSYCLYRFPITVDGNNGNIHDLCIFPTISGDE